MKKPKVRSKDAICEWLLELACKPANDVIRLTYLQEAQETELKHLDLDALTEFKRSGNGTLEVKLIDRVAVAEKIMQQLDSKEEGATAFFRALETTAEQTVSQR